MLLAFSSVIDSGTNGSILLMLNYWELGSTESLASALTQATTDVLSAQTGRLEVAAPLYGRFKFNKRLIHIGVECSSF